MSTDHTEPGADLNRPAAELRDEAPEAPPPSSRGAYWLWMLIGGPITFLSMQLLRYMLRDPACERRDAFIAMEVCGGIVLAVGIQISWSAWRHWQRQHVEWSNDAPDHLARERFLAIMALLLGLFTIAGALALWAPSLFLSPCDTQ